MNDSSTRVRFAPSPTGYLHIGSARTALFNWLFARRHGGTYVLRIEDTDQKRNTPEAVAAILEGLKWLNLEPDEGPEQGGPYGPYFQSQRADLHGRAIEELKQSDAIYPCFCTKERLERLREERKGAGGGAWGYDGHCRDLAAGDAERRRKAGESHAWRLKVPRPGTSTFTDMILGPQAVDHADVEDIILVRPDGTPTYNLAVVMDDHAMRISHVIRGQDHLTNTFKQILIYESLGWAVPAFGHISLILAPPPHSGKLSKRHGGAEVKEYQERGYHPEGLVNWLALIGWSYGSDEEFLTRDALIARFDMANAGTSNARMNPSKLDAISGHHIRLLPEAEFRAAIAPYLVRAGYLQEGEVSFDAKLALIAEFARPRCDHFDQVTELVDWAFTDPAYEKDALKALRKSEGAAQFLTRYAESLPDPLPGPEALEEQAREFTAAQGLSFGTFAKAVRAAVTGRMKTPPLFHCIALLGREEAARRLALGAERAASQT